MYPNPADVLAFPPRPHLEQFKKRAKALVKACKSGECDAMRTWAADWIESLASALPTSDGDLRARFDQRVNQIEDFAWKTLSASDRRTAICTLADAQFVIARVHGFKSWPHCARHINALTRTTSPISQFESAVEAVITGDMAGSWTLSAEGYVLERVLAQDGKKITGTLQGPHGPMPLKGQFARNRITFSGKGPDGIGGREEFSATGVPKPDGMLAGRLTSTTSGKLTWSAVRTAGR